MLIATPKSWFSWDFTVMEGDRPIAGIDVSSWREKGVLTVQGIDYCVYRERMISGAFLLESSGQVIARAEKPSAFHRLFTIEHAGRQYTLRAKSALRRAFVLLEGDREIGSLSPTRIFTREAALDLPGELPLVLRVFIVWLAIILWKRDSDAAS